MGYDVSGNDSSAVAASGGTTHPASGTSETWTMANGVNVPTATTGGPQFRIQDAAVVGNANLAEIILVTNISGATWTVTRGAEPCGVNGTTPVAHAASATYAVVGTYGALLNMLPPIYTNAAATGTLPVQDPTVFPCYVTDNYTLSGATTLTMPPLTLNASKNIWVNQPGGGSYTLSWSASPAIRWVGGVAATQPGSGQRMWCSFVCDGTNWLGLLISAGF